MKKFFSGFLTAIMLLIATSAFGDSSNTVPGTVVPTKEVTYPSVRLNAPGVALAVYGNENSGVFIPTYEGPLSKIILKDNGKESVIFNSPVSGFVLSGHDNISISGENVILAPTDDGEVIVPEWSKITTGKESLQDELDAMQEQINTLKRQIAAMQK